MQPIKENKKVEFISIPNGLSSAIIGDDELFRNIVILYKLKALYVGGIVLNYKSRYNELRTKITQYYDSSDKIKHISESTLRKSISYLKKEGLVKVENGNLLLASKNLLIEKYRVSRKKRTKLKTMDISFLKEKIQTLSVDENLKKQKFIVVNKITVQEISEIEGTIHSEKIYKKIYNRRKKHIIQNFESYIEKYKKRFNFRISNLDFNKKKINPNITLSRQKVANVLNRKSKSTGSRIIKKLKGYSYIEDNSNKILLFKDSSYNEYVNLKYNSNLNITNNNILFFKDNIYYLLANNLIVNSSEL